jgi:hypothetical protein
MDSKTARIRALNDELRQNFAGGAAVMTPGIAALGAEAVARIVKTIGVFDDFCHNDPHEEHDFGAFDADGQRVFFKIDYFDESPVADDAGRGCGDACIPGFMSRCFTDDEQRTQGYEGSEVSELRPEEALRRYLRDRDGTIIFIRIREPDTNVPGRVLRLLPLPRSLIL